MGRQIIDGNPITPSRPRTPTVNDRKVKPTTIKTKPPVPAPVKSKPVNKVDAKYGAWNKTVDKYGTGNKVVNKYGTPYAPGSFQDPGIDWNAIRAIFGGGDSGGGSGPSSGGYSASSGGYSGGGDSGGLASYSPPVAPVAEAPATYTAPSYQAPLSISAEAGQAAGAPTGASFQTFGGNPGTFGQFERLRNARGPRNTGSITPEMLRRAAQARMLG